MALTIKQKQRICEVLNSLERIEIDPDFIIVEASKENLTALEAVGVSRETALKYGDSTGADFCILALAFGENYADLCDGENLIKFDEFISVNDSEFLIGRFGDKVSLGYFDGDVYQPIEISEHELFAIASILTKAVYENE